MHAKSLKSSLILGNPMDCSLPGSSVHGILQARILKWVAMPSSTESKYFLACDKLKFCFLELSHFSCSVVSNSLQPHVLQHARLPCLSPPPGACANSSPTSWWCHPTISSSVVPFTSCPQSFPASSESFPVSQFFASSGQCFGVSASVLSMNIQDWFPFGLAGLISLQSKGLSRVFSNTTVQKPQFFGAQLSLWSNSHIHTWLLEKP